MHLSRFALPALLAPVVLSLAASTAGAGVIVVDPANGPGTDFTSLSSAIAAASSGDVLLLRTGTYDGSFVVSGKTLSLVADEDAQVTITNSALGNASVPALQVGSSSADTIVVRGLTLSTPAGGGVPLVVSGASVPGGSLFLEECTVPAAAGSGMVVGNGSPAVLSRCASNGSNADATPGPDGFPIAIGGSGLVLGAGPMALFGGTYLGGNGLDAGLYGPVLVPTPGQHGGSGIRSENPDNSLKVLASTLCIGGEGGDGASPGGNCLPPGDGGDGVLAAANGNVLLCNGIGLGNFPGTGAPGCGQSGQQGGLIAAIPPAQLPTFINGTPVSLVVSRAVREQEFATLTLSDAGDDDVTLLVGFAPAFTYAANLHGVLAVMPTLAIGLGHIPFPGTVSFDVRIPELGPGVESQFAFIQALSKDSLGRKTLGMPTVILMLDDSF